MTEVTTKDNGLAETSDPMPRVGPDRLAAEAGSKVRDLKRRLR